MRKPDGWGSVPTLRKIALVGLAGMLAASLGGCTSDGSPSSASSAQASHGVLPRLSKARLEGVWNVRMKVTKNTLGSKPNRKQSGWKFHPTCATGACHVLFKGTVDRDHLRFPMSERRGNYQGSGGTRHPSCGSVPAQLAITLTEAEMDDRGRWVATAWEGTYTRRSDATCGGMRLRTLIVGTPTWAPQT